MSVATRPPVDTIVYPESDGQPLAENTKQFRWITIIKGNLDILFADRADVFVAGDLLWYPVESEPTIRRAPDAMVVIGRPKGDRGAYLQWREDDLPPQVVFEVLSPGNTLTEMVRKLEFYEQYSVEEYYIYDPDRNDLSGCLREGERLRVIDPIDGWTSPRLGVRFVLGADELAIFFPDGRPFLDFVQLNQRAEQAEQQAAAERQRAEQAEQRAGHAEQRAEQLAARLRALGIDPDA